MMPNFAWSTVHVSTHASSTTKDIVGITSALGILVKARMALNNAYL